jgi:type IX secretion system PorP/SprF family membrane protein
MNMFRKLLFTACGLLGVSALYAQQTPLFSQYMNNDYVLNPAIGGTKESTQIRSVLRSQWTGIEGQPNTQTLSMHGKLGKKVGIGGYIFNDNIGPISQTGISASYAYRLEFGNNTRLSLGLGALAYLYKINTNELKFDSQGSSDNVLDDGNFRAFYPNFSFGALYYGDKFYVGASVPELLQTKISSSNEFFIMREVRHYYLMGGYKFRIGDKYTIEPSTLLKYVHAAPFEIDLSAKFTAYDKFSLGASYRSNDAVVAFMGFKFKERYHIGYSYDITMTELSNYTKGSHEIMLGFDLTRKKDQPSL